MNARDPTYGNYPMNAKDLPAGMDSHMDTRDLSTGITRWMPEIYLLRLAEVCRRSTCLDYKMDARDPSTRTTR
jgi:hypothetical protein